LEIKLRKRNEMKRNEGVFIEREEKWCRKLAGFF
jgi:hypothetical protein